MFLRSIPQRTRALAAPSTSVSGARDSATALSRSNFSLNLNSCSCGCLTANSLSCRKALNCSSIRFNSSTHASIRSFSSDSSDPNYTKALASVRSLIKSNDILLFMKGSPLFPQCGFSRTVVEVLKREGLEVANDNHLDGVKSDVRTVNVLDPHPEKDGPREVRDAVKEVADWQTIPQLWVRGEFVGGCDIVVEMHRAGELKEVVGGKGKKGE